MPLGSSLFRRSAVSFARSRCAPLCAVAFTTFVVSTAHADQYYTVAPGDTLASIAARYSTLPEVLRKANSLSSYGDGMTLPAMLLRVPDGDKSISRAANPAPTVNNAANGTVRATAAYRVQQGDTLESIAQRYTQSGYHVTAEDIRVRNTLNGQPTVGSTVYVPLGSATYTPPRTQLSSTNVAGKGYTPSTQSVGNGTFLSEELPLPMASVLRPQDQPKFAAPAPRAQMPAQRGPTALPSRGFFPNPSINTPNGRLEGARVLAPNEEAPNLAPGGGARVSRSPQTQTTPTRSTTLPPSLGRVAKVALRGAMIRRLPTSDASTLYRCSTGLEVAVTKTQGQWAAILMSDKSIGWLPARYIRYTGANVDISAALEAAREAADDNSTAWSSGGSFSLPGHWTSSNAVVSQALTWMGTPYVYGGTSRRGIDCSSLVQHAFASCGYRLPRTAAQQARVGNPVDPANLQPGDRLYFSKSGTRIDHTGLYMGNGRFVHASGRGRSVIVSNLADGRNWNIFVCARR